MMTDTAEVQQPVDVRSIFGEIIWLITLRQGNRGEVDQLINSLTNQHESLLFQEVGKLTRQLHDALGKFS